MDKELKQALDDLINKYHIGDYIYDVRSRVGDDDNNWFIKNPNASSWDHPDVLKFTECISIIKKALE